MTLSIPEIIKEFEERAESTMQEYEIDPPGINYGAVRDNLSFWLTSTLTRYRDDIIEEMMVKENRFPETTRIVVNFIGTTASLKPKKISLDFYDRKK